MAEIRKMDYKAISVRCNEEGKDFIPSNWYIPARKAWQIVAWLLVQLRNEAKIRDDKTTDKMIHQYWEYIEDRAITFGEENEDEDQSCNSLRLSVDNERSMQKTVAVLYLRSNQRGLHMGSVVLCI